MTPALDQVKHSTVHRQGKEEEGIIRKETKKPPKEIGPEENAAPPVEETPAGCFSIRPCVCGLTGAQT